MNSENKDWKPEVGKTAWYYNSTAMTIREVAVVSFGGTKTGYRVKAYPGGEEHGDTNDTRFFFPTAEAALASIKVYDLEGKEVVIPRARVDLPVKYLGGCEQKTRWIDGN